MEIEYAKGFRIWLQFVNEYKNRGGRVCTGSDVGFGLKLYGFEFVRELELLQEAGFHPLEVIRAATLKGAELLGVDDEIGTIEVGKKADLVIVEENPLKNLKTLYGTGHMKYNDDTHTVERIGGVLLVIKDGIIYDAKQLLVDVAEIVAQEKKEN
jgi:imidazolonepropionase-like amidohydrolase